MPAYHALFTLLVEP